jgi:hypothetical protein
MARVFTHSTSVPLATLVLGLSACGGSDAPSSSAPTTTATEGPTATATAVATATPTPATATAPSAPSPPPDAPTPTATANAENQPGGAGDEAAARVPVAVTVGSDGTISPGTVYVPAFFALELRVRNRTAGTLRVSWTASEPSGAFDVGAGKVSSRQVAAPKRGTYFLAIDGAGTAAVVAGGQPGP